MPSFPRAASASLPLILLVALAGCAPGGGGTGEEPAAEPVEEGSGGSTECVARTWALDIDDAASQVGEYLGSSGLSVISSTGEGVQTISFTEDGHVSTHNDVTFMISADGGDGVEITVVQTHSGDTAGDWFWEGDSDSRVTFEGYEGEYTVRTTTIVNGTAGETTATPGGELDGSGMTIECADGTLATHADGSPFTQHWVPRD